MIYSKLLSLLGTIIDSNQTSCEDQTLYPKQ